MKHIYEFENFLNEGAIPVNLYDVKSDIRVFGDSIKVKYTDDYPTGNSWKDVPGYTSYKQIPGITFSVLGPDWIQCVLPSVQLEKDRRFYLCLAIPGIFGKDPKEIKKYNDDFADTYRIFWGTPLEPLEPGFIVSSFGKPTNRMAKVNKEVPGLNEKPQYVPSEHIGKKTTWSFKNKFMEGGELFVTVDATKAKYRNV